MTARLVRIDGRDAAEQMAIDEALARAPQAGPVLRLYRWPAPAVSWGYFLDGDALAAALGEGYDQHQMVRRPTGGGLVEHGRDLTYTLVLPTAGCNERGLTVDQAFIVASRLVWGALRRAGVQATTAVGAPLERPSACASTPVSGDALIDGLKVAGCAARRMRGTMLLQGYVALDLLERHELTWSALADALTAQAQTLWPMPWRADALTDTERASVVQLAEQRYRTAAWNRVPNITEAVTPR